MTARLIYSCPNRDCTVSTIVIEPGGGTRPVLYCDCDCRMDYEGIE